MKRDLPITCYPCIENATGERVYVDQRELDYHPNAYTKLSTGKHERPEETDRIISQSVYAEPVLAAIKADMARKGAIGQTLWGIPIVLDPTMDPDTIKFGNVIATNVGKPKP